LLNHATGTATTTRIAPATTTSYNKNIHITSG
jgi:hypothetical protein